MRIILVAILAALSLASAAYFLARATGFAKWTTWKAGDAFDVGLLVFVGVLLMIWAVKA